VIWFATNPNAMRRISLLLLLGIALLITHRHFLTAQSTASIEGLVLESTSGRPLDGVQISVVEELLNQATAITTDSMGHFITGPLRPGPHLLVPTKQGFVYSRSPNVRTPREPGFRVLVLEGKIVQGIQVQMTRQGVITGRVFDSRGQPIVNTIVGLSSRAFDSNGVRRLVAVPGIGPARTDDRGQYRFAGLQRGDYYPRFLTSISTMPFDYLPGTTDEARAVPVHIQDGQEVEISPVTIEQTPTVGIRLHFSEPSARPVLRNISLGDTRLSVSAVDTGQMTLPRMGYGSFDTLLSWTTMGELFYSRFRVNVDPSGLDQIIVIHHGIKISGSAYQVDANGKRSKSEGVECLLHLDNMAVLRSPSPPGCMEWQVWPSEYRLELKGMPLDAYVVKAEASGRDFLAGPLQIDTDTDISVQLASPGGIVEGKVTTGKGETIADGIVVLVPDAPLREANLLYRTAISASDGSFQLRGIRPGSYHLFAWQDLEGAEYRNAAFIKQFEGFGTPVQIEKIERLVVDISVAAEAKPNQN
jgi:hypothetical protein